MSSKQISRVFQIHMLLDDKWNIETNPNITTIIRTKFKCQEKLFTVKNVYCMTGGDKKMYYVTTTTQSSELNLSPSFLLCIDEIDDQDEPTGNILPQCSEGGWAGAKIKPNI